MVLTEMRGSSELRFRDHKQRQTYANHNSKSSLLLHNGNNNRNEHLTSANNSHDRLREAGNRSIKPVEFYQIEPTTAANNITAPGGQQELLLGVYATTDSPGRPPALLLQASGYTQGDHFNSSGLEQHLRPDSLGDCLAKYGANQTNGIEAKGLVVCNDNHLSLMDIRSEEYNFSDIERVWLVKSWQEILLRVAFVVPIVLLGTLGNATIIYSMCRFKPIRSKPTNIFILNMALADLLTTIVCPNAALFTDIYQFYVLGSFISRTEGFIKITCLLVSAYSLIVLSFDWFLSVVKPFRSRLGIRQAWTTLASIWLVSILMAVPLLFSRKLRERHWRDLTEIWCCELIQYTKYYWVCITLFLIYLPTFIMTVVLVVILLQMDRFEAKLRKSRNHPAARNPSSAWRTSPSSAGVMRSSSFSVGLDTSHNHPSANISSIMTTASNQQQFTTGTTVSSAGLSAGHNSSLSISMKYRRRIVKILLFYLLTSIVCWTPLQFTIVYRHFRSEAMPAKWFFELNFFAQLCASLSSAMNPIIFGFLSQPFRRIVIRSWLCRLVDKLWMGKRRRSARRDRDNNARKGPRGNGAQGHRGAEELAMGNRNAVNLGSSRVANPIRNLANKLTDLQATTSTRGADLELQPKLTIDYMEHQQPNQLTNNNNNNNNNRYSNQTLRHLRNNLSRAPIQSGLSHQEHRPRSATIVAENHQVAVARRELRHPTVRRSLSSALNGVKTLEDGRKNQRHKRQLVAAAAAAGTDCGLENEAFSPGGDSANT